METASSPASSGMPLKKDLARLQAAAAAKRPESGDGSPSPPASSPSRPGISVRPGARAQEPGVLPSPEPKSSKEPDTATAKLVEHVDSFKAPAYPLKRALETTDDAHLPSKKRRSSVGGSVDSDDGDARSGSDGEKEAAATKSSGDKFPQRVTHILKNWLFEHFDRPYPTDEEKAELIKQTNISIKQLNNWFINARRRIWKPSSSTKNEADKMGAPYGAPGFPMDPNMGKFADRHGGSLYPAYEPHAMNFVSDGSAMMKAVPPMMAPGVPPPMVVPGPGIRSLDGYFGAGGSGQMPAYPPNAPGFAGEMQRLQDSLNSANAEKDSMQHMLFAKIRDLELWLANYAQANRDLENKVRTLEQENSKLRMQSGQQPGAPPPGHQAPHTPHQPQPGPPHQGPHTPHQQQPPHVPHQQAPPHHQPPPHAQHQQPPPQHQQPPHPHPHQQHQSHQAHAFQT